MERKEIERKSDRERDKLTNNEISNLNGLLHYYFLAHKINAIKNKKQIDEKHLFERCTLLVAVILVYHKKSFKTSVRILDGNSQHVTHA